MSHFEKHINIFGHKFEFLGSKSDKGSEIKNNWIPNIPSTSNKIGQYASIPTQKNHENDIFATFSK